MNTQDLNKSVQYVKGIGPRRAAFLATLGIHTVRDLCCFFPRRYEDRSSFTPIADVVVGETATLRGIVKKKGVRRTRSMDIFDLILEDASGMVQCLFFKQPYLDRTFMPGDTVIVTGKVEQYKNRKQMNAPDYEVVRDESEGTVHVGRVVPVYPLTQGLTQRALRKSMKGLVDAYVALLEENLPDDLIERYDFMARQDAVRELHFPSSLEIVEKARFRMAFEEFYLYEKTIAERIKKRQKLISSCAITNGDLLKQSFSQLLPFQPTESQTHAMSEIVADLACEHPMNRILQGDVGSGKTVVSACALFVVAKNHSQAAFLVPTEILAEQHYGTLVSIFKGHDLSVGLLTGTTPGAERKKLLQQLADGSLSILVGTHALLQEDIVFSRLGLVVVDEQHKFGVRQRMELLGGETKPHLLVMSATPIPRTLGLTLYGDLSMSTLRSLPFGERSVKTYWIARKKQREVFDFVRKKIAHGDQVYIVFPLIEETEKSDLKAAKQEYEKIKKDVFPEYAVALMHGKVDKEEKSSIMHDFKSGKIQVLVSTTVIEVGVDNQNASIIIIENAERFGLSQLHQMRGRVGRGHKESFCFLFGDPTTDTGKKRLRLMTRTNDGFKIAEEDLYLRGPGDFLGTRQSGLPDFRVADVVRDVDILRAAKKEAFVRV